MKIKIFLYKSVSLLQKLVLGTHHTIVKRVTYFTNIAKIYTRGLFSGISVYLPDSIGGLWVESRTFDTATLF